MTRRPEGFRGKDRLASLLLGHRPLRVCSLVAPRHSAFSAKTARLGIFKQALPPAKTRACTDRLAARSLATLQQVGGKTALLFRDLQGGASPGYWPMPNDFPCSTGRLPGPVFNREKLDFRIILVVPELRFVTPRLNGFVPPGFGGLFECQVPISIGAEGDEFDRVEIIVTACGDRNYQLAEVSMVRTAACPARGRSYLGMAVRQVRSRR